MISPLFSRMALGAVVLAFSVSHASAQDIPVTESVKSTGKLTVASSLSYAPFEFVDENGKPTGLDIELATEMSKLLNVKLDLVTIPFASQIPGLAADRIQIAWSSFTVTKERLAQVDFVSFLQAGAVIVSTPAKAQSFAGENAICGRKIAVQSGSAADFVADKLSKKCIAVGKKAIDKEIYPESKDTIQAVMSGRAEARLDDSTAAGYFQTTSGGKQVVVGHAMMPSPLGVAVRKGDTATAEMLKATFAEFIKNGTYQKILKSYNMTSSAVSAPVIYTDASQLSD